MQIFIIFLLFVASKRADQLTHVPFPETKTFMIIITIYYSCLEKKDGYIL